MRNSEIELTQKELQHHLHYDPDTGLFHWNHPVSRSVWKGDVAGSWDRYYTRIKIRGKAYRAEQLAFLYMTGAIPRYIKSINGDRSDTRWANLKGRDMVKFSTTDKVDKKPLRKKYHVQVANSPIWVEVSRKAVKELQDYFGDDLRIDTSDPVNIYAHVQPKEP